MLIGGGGREKALVTKLSSSKHFVVDGGSSKDGRWIVSVIPELEF